MYLMQRWTKFGGGGSELGLFHNQDAYSFQFYPNPFGTNLNETLGIYD